MCFGLRTDFQGKLFPGSPELLAIADSLREIRTIAIAAQRRRWSSAMIPRQALTEGDQVAIEKSLYVSLCRKHWEEETGHLAQPGAQSGPNPRKAQFSACKFASRPVHFPVGFFSQCAMPIFDRHNGAV